MSEQNLLKILCYNIYINKTCPYSFTKLYELLQKNNIPHALITIKQLFSNFPFHLIDVNGIKSINELDRYLTSQSDIIYFLKIMLDIMT